MTIQMRKAIACAVRYSYHSRRCSWTRLVCTFTRSVRDTWTCPHSLYKRCDELADNTFDRNTTVHIFVDDTKLSYSFSDVPGRYAMHEHLDGFMMRPDR